MSDFAAQLRRSLPLLTAIFLAAGLMAWMVPATFLDPNGHLYMIGGDGFIISYHIHYFTQFGSGFRLTDMNYPFGELIFMTDNQAVLSLVLNRIHDLWPPIERYVTGIQNGLLLYSAPLAAVFFFLSFRRLGIPGWRAVVWSLILLALMPQINRMMSGHFGLGYLWILPLSAWWMIRAIQGDHRWSGTLVLLAILMIFGFNNPYLILICASFFGAFTLVSGLAGARRIIPHRIWLPALVLTLVPPLVVGAVIGALDEVTDRVVENWGFFVHVAQFESIFYPAKGPIHDWIHQLTPIAKVSWEGTAYVGLSGTLVLPFLIGGWIRRMRASLKSGWWRLADSTELSLLLWTSLPALLFAFNILGSEALKWIPEQFTVLYQFRAPGRFAWIFQMVYGMTAAWTVDRFLLGRQLTRPVLKAVLAILLIGLWAWEGYIYLDDLKPRPEFGDPYGPKDMAPIRNHCRDLHIDTSAYQAIYLLPMHTGWTGKLIQPDFFFAEFMGYRYSLATGIPLITAKLSRISLGQAAISAEWADHPWMERPGFASLPDRRDILLVVHKDATFSPGEQFLMDHASLILDEEYYRLYTLSADADLDSGIREANVWAETHGWSTTPVNRPGQLPVWRDFDEHPSDHTFCGPGAIRLEPGWDTLAFIPLTRHDALWVEASCWFALEREHFGMPGIRILQKTPQGEVNFSDVRYAAFSKDIHEGWMRASFEFSLHWDCDTLFIFSEHQFPGLADNLLVRVTSDTLVQPMPGHPDLFLLNNYPVPRRTTRPDSLFIPEPPKTSPAP